MDRLRALPGSHGAHRPEQRSELCGIALRQNPHACEEIVARGDVPEQARTRIVRGRAGIAGQQAPIEVGKRNGRIAEGRLLECRIFQDRERPKGKQIGALP
ncbi:hypothetical protein GCM10009095_22330 [Sphingomonas molluscorum]